MEPFFYIVNNFNYDKYVSKYVKQNYELWNSCHNKSKFIMTGDTWVSVSIALDGHSIRSLCFKW